jgi:HIRAN domain
MPRAASGTLDLMTLALEVSRAEGRCAALIGDGKYRFEIVGASRYQAGIEAAAGGRTEDSAEYYSAVLLLPEPTNRYDRSAVSVRLSTGVVGYLRKDLAPLFLQGLREGSFDMAVCGAVIVGAWNRAGRSSGNLSVRLDAFVPFRLEEPHRAALA